MKALIIGNIFKSISMQVVDFPKIDGESTIVHLGQKDTGAVLVVATICHLCNIDIKVISQNIQEGSIDELKEVKTNSPNKLITIYNNKLERNSYAYIPYPLSIKDVDVNFSQYDVTFFCCIESTILDELYKINNSLSRTHVVLMPNGLVDGYFKNLTLKYPCDFLFINRGELHIITSSQVNQDINLEIRSLNLNKSNLVVTDGGNGVFTLFDNELHHFNVTPVKNIAHPGGAGDSFATGFISAYFNEDIRSNKISTAIQSGHQYATKVLGVYDISELWKED